MEWMKPRNPLRHVGLLCLLLFTLSVFVTNCGQPPGTGPGTEAILSSEANGDGGSGKVPGTCTHLCDCEQGKACTNGKCVDEPGLTALYCCANAGCVPGKACVDRANKQATCPASAQCITSGDCGQPSCQSVGDDCEESVPECVNGQCSKTPKPVKNAVCDPSRQVCVPRAPVCKQNCDCGQGEFCNNGTCEVGSTSTYCCSKPGCPTGESCYEVNGSIGTCKSPKCGSNTDCGTVRCNQQGSKCTELSPECQQDGSCRSISKTIEGQCSSTGRCVAAQGCKTDCDCPQTLTCVQGQCVPLSSRRSFCCDKPGCTVGQTCTKRDGTQGVCGKPSTCMTDSECGKPACQDSGGFVCLQEQPACDIRSSTCNVQITRLANHVCNKSNGNCEPIPPEGCKSACDCPQGQDCLNGTCGVGPSGQKAYCCDNPGCPSGQACVTKSGQKGACPGQPKCTQDADCGNSSCQNSGTSCVVTTPKCDTSTGTCTKASTQTPNAICDSATATCKPSTAPCTSHCDCPQGSYCYQGKCERGSYAYYCCDNPGCPKTAQCVSRLGTVGFCPVSCKSACDCDTGQDCINSICQATTNPVFCCDDPQKCPTGASCKDKSNKAGTCPAKPRACKTVCDCVQGEACTNGTCQPSSNPTYCCDNPGCPTGKGCVSNANLSGVCPKSCKLHCDCDQGYACIAGLCQRNPLVGNVYCCSKPGCPAGQFCYQPNGQNGRCQQQRCTSPCDCSQGEDCRSGVCVATQPPVYCCSKTGCPSGSNCKDSSGKWGQCKQQAQCKTACDCPQGQDCYNGQCVGIFPAVYCCENVGCPVNQACVDKNNKAGFCPGAKCTNACDCPIQGQSCVRGQCVYLLGSARVYCCDKPYCPAGNQCEDSKGNLQTCSANSCKNACDCKQGEDCRNGQCVLVSPPVYCCSKLGCPSRYPCITTSGGNSVCQ